MATNKQTPTQMHIVYLFFREGEVFFQIGFRLKILCFAKRRILHKKLLWELSDISEMWSLFDSFVFCFFPSVFPRFLPFFFSSEKLEKFMDHFEIFFNKLMFFRNGLIIIKSHIIIIVVEFDEGFFAEKFKNFFFWKCCFSYSLLFFLPIKHTNS